MSYTRHRFVMRLLPAPGRGSFWLNMAGLLLIVTLQFSVIPSLAGARYLDFVTPWLTYHFITMRTGSAMLQGIIGSLALELHGSAPAGLYLCAYWVMGLVIISIRQHISWRNPAPWISVMMISQLWIILFELFVYLIKVASLEYFNSDILLTILCRLLFTFMFVLMLSGSPPGRSAEEKSI